ncbi:MAG: hypothetical protein V4612_05960 [Pseudomonadota bacterium]
MGFVEKKYNQLKNLANKLFGQQIFVAGFFLVFFVTLATFLLSDRIFSQAVLSDCTGTSLLNTAYPPNICNPIACSSPALSASTAKNPDNNAGYNCYYAPLGVPLRPCKAFLNAAASNPQKPRENCADLIDLPLCSALLPSNVVAGINCVVESANVPDPNSLAIPRKVRGIDYAVNNKDSIRFCGQVENCASGEVCNQSQMSSASNCTTLPKCHQLTASQTPNNGINCNVLKCNLLAVDELKVADSRFDNELKQYCDGSTTKCYEFFNNSIANPNNSFNLQYLRYRTNNTMCQIHTCRPDSALCGADDTQNILSKDSTYQTNYIQYINAGMPIESGLCAPISCQPVAFRQYRCSPFADDEPSTLNNNCDVCVSCAQGEVCPAANGCAAGQKPQNCSGGYCNKIVDCNSPSNVSQPECIVSNPESQDTTGDLFNAWFYRPTPPSRITDGNGLILANINPEIKDTLCYSFDNVKSNGWGTQYNTVLFGTYYWHTLAMATRSPKLCSGGANGFRAPGYGSLCGTESNIFKNPSDNLGYVSGIASVNYELEQPEYKIKACLRYSNSIYITGATGTLCGARDCRFDISDGPLSDPTQANWCGYDVCKTMTISQSDIDRCSMQKHSEIFDTDTTPDCVSGSIDGFVRMRARKYGRRICVFVDQKGAVAYSKKNFDGTEKLSDGTCVDGDGALDANGNCDGKNTNDANGVASVWRTVKMIKYIGNNRAGNQKSGYIDMNGRFFAEQDCAKIPLRIGPPRFYGVATIANSKNLFEPPLYIVNVRTARGGQIASAAASQQFGFTDFYNPEIVVGYGSVQQKMSLGAGFLGNDEVPENYPNSPWSTIINNSVGQTAYQADVYIAKEYDDTLSVPTLCLYRRVNDATGAPTDPIRISCIKRNKPEISDVFNNRARMKVSIIPDPNNIFDNVKLKFRLIVDHGANNQNDNCGADDICSDEFVFPNSTTIDTTADDSCTRNIEAYKLCSRRDVCSKLVYECADNEIALHNAIVNGASTAQFDAIKANCNGAILSSCNRKLGIINSAAADFFSQIDTSASAANNIDPNYQNFQSLLNNSAKATIDPRHINAYGWFNEMCIVKGFEDKLKTVVAYKTVDGVLGKCLPDVIKSLYLNDGDSSTNCDAGGKAPYCVCIEATDNTVLPDCQNTPAACQEIRLQTPREAGLCMDIIIPRFCQAVDFTSVNNSDPNDPNFAISSVTKSEINNIFGPNYSDANGVHTSHQLRQANITLNPAIFDINNSPTNSNHAEYGSVLGGTSSVYGFCNGFWKPQTNSSGTVLSPTLNCSIDGNWQKPTLSNSCIRYSCSAINNALIIQSGAPENNSYQNDYAVGETGDNRGAKNGYALWPAKQKTNDFLENVTASSCIIGYKLARDTNNNILNPIRACNQLGVWEPVNNSCTRIKCSAITIANGALPATRTTQAQIDLWNQYGGAEFAEGKASRSDLFVPDESKVAGVCNQNLGFFPSGINAPTMECDYLGNWTNLQNPCTRLNCDQRSGDTAATPNNGFANWPTTNIPNNQSVIVSATSCSAGYFKNPYQPMPTRQCESIFSGDEWKSRWNPDLPVVNPCINKCPGSNIDATIGVGITSQFISSTLTKKIDISWPSITPIDGPITANSYAYTADNCSNMNASTFTKERVDGCYRLRRLCGNGTNGFAKGQWGPVESMCVANGGTVGNATYLADNDISTTGSGDSAIVNTELTGSCIPDYSFADAALPPKIKCSFKNSSNFIDQTYWQPSSGQDCKKNCSGLVEGYSEDVVLNHGASGSKTCNVANYVGTVKYSCSDGTISTNQKCTRPPCVNGAPIDRAGYPEYCYRNRHNNNDACFIIGSRTRSQVECGNNGDYVKNFIPPNMNNGDSISMTQEIDPHSITAQFQCVDGTYKLITNPCQ